MSNGDLNWIANYIWGIADDVLRDLYVRGKYRDVILPMTVLRRLDAVLEDGKQAVLVEQSRRDDYWGAKVADDGMLVGMNVLGRLLMELRAHLSADTSTTLRVVEPPPISEFLLFAKPIETVWGDQRPSQPSETEIDLPPTISVQTHSDPIQPSFFDDQFAERLDAPDASAGESDRDIVLEPYASYRESGVEWLEEVPAHWDVRQLGQFGVFSKGSGGNKEDEVSTGVPCIRYGDLYTTHKFFIRRSRSYVSCKRAQDYTPIRYGDVLFAASGETIEEIGKSAVNLIPTDARCGGDIVLFRPKREIEARYLGYTADCAPAAIQKATMGRGITVIHIYTDQLKRLSVTLPPVPEQAAIVRFLDHADQRIRRYIRAKEKLIALLEEQKQAIIHQAVTGRIDVRTGQPYPAYKPSGVEWLGYVPETWRTSPLRRITLDRCDGPFGSGLKSSHYTGHGIRVVRLQNIGHGEFDDSDAAYISAEHYGTLGEHSVEARDILIAGLGDPNRPAGRACVAPTRIVPAMVKADCFRFRMNRDVVFPEFISLQLTATAAAASALLSTGATRQRINLQTTSARLVGIPSVREQVRIVEYVEERTSHIRTAEQAAKEEINLIREYRTRLIADVVTGKLDVREAAAALPEVDAFAEDDGADGPLDAGEVPAFDDESEPAEVVG